MTTPSTPLPFFVYGTLRPGEPNHDRFLRGRTESEEPARLHDAALYDGPGYPYAVEAPGAQIVGELVTARPEAYPQLLIALDRLEDYAPGDPANLYERVELRVTRDADADADADTDGTSVHAWVYLAAPTVAARLRTHGKLIEGGDWINRR
ncbi:gamma-glutamylcyclotransferase family protein [Streptomyces prunicolor]|uniref:gamma-glutamylcyclotransferase family protein n=1 Tax=Streptomyces prunicolor TaxID=67348 RepID=UPI00343243B1